MTEVAIKFPDLTQEKRKHLFKAERELSKAGIHFDTGYGCKTRVWEFDWSLKGAEVNLKGSKKNGK